MIYVVETSRDKVAPCVTANDSLWIRFPLEEIKYLKRESLRKVFTVEQYSGLPVPRHYKSAAKCLDDIKVY